MQIHIETENDRERERMIRLLLYSLNNRREDIDSMRLRLSALNDTLGARLYRCRVHAALRGGQILELEETQASSDLAVTRAVERCARTIQRRLHGPESRRIM